MRDLDILLFKCQDPSILSYIPEYIDTSKYIFEDYKFIESEGEYEAYADSDTIASEFIMNLHNKKLGGLRLNIYIPTDLSYSVDMIISVLKAAYCLPYLEINILRYDINKSIWRIHNFQRVLELWNGRHCEPRTYNESYYT